ncbi:DNA-processing protein DprA [Bacillus cereus]|uniref:DNA-processing protein DprA n=1 Tax=Bacillus cereus TaxID=1396 RepID=UPI0009B1B940|nr:DNA-processing protein DprA [Bacillus cereus]
MRLQSKKEDFHFLLTLKRLKLKDEIHYGGVKMLKNLLMLQKLGINGGFIDYAARNFSKKDFSLLFEGSVVELQFKYNIFSDKELDIFYNIDNIKKVEESTDVFITNNKKQNIRILSYYDSEYPTSLKALDKKPLFLYAKGNVELLNSPKSIACVGTRKPSKHIVEAVHDIVQGLVKENVVIVSGLAKGIDTESHQACLYNRGKTIAVLAHGLDTIYPKGNIDLAESILNNDGLLLSEYPIETNIKKHNFVARNRIISALSQGVIIFEADEKSGTMHTSRFAYKQGKKIFCPNIIQEPEKLSSGVKKLLTTGNAYPIKNSSDVMYHTFETQTSSVNINLKTSSFKELEHMSKITGFSIDELINEIITRYIEGERNYE